MSEREKRRRRVFWWLDFGERLFIGLLAGLGVRLLDGPDWAIFVVAWLSALAIRNEQHAAARNERIDQETRP